jgi:transducin (beta)-like 1
MCMWNPVLKQLASGSSDGMCRLWGLDELANNQWEVPDKTELPLRTAVLPHSDHKTEKNKDVTSIAWSPDGKHIATGCYDGTARIWDATGNIVALLKDHSGPVFSLKWSKKGTHLLSGSYDRRAIVWSLATGKAIKIFLLHTAPVLDVDWRDGEMFATCSTDW